MAHALSGRPLPPLSPLAGQFLIDPTVCFLNHGSFGAVPRAVLEEQRRLQERVEAEPVRFFVEELQPLLDAARREVAAFLHAPAADLVFVRNATEGVNAVVRSLSFEPGDEIITSTHEYNACNNAVAYAAARAGAKVVQVRLPCPVTDAGEVVASLMDAVTPRTRLVLLSHVTSPSGLILPVKEVIDEMERRGVDVLVDGAHAPGYVPLEIGSLGAAYYTANLHKWCCAPKGAAVLYVRPDRQERIVPATISHGANSVRTDYSRFQLNFDFTGSDDYSPWLLAPAAIRHVGSLIPGGWPAVRTSGAAKAAAAADALLRRLARYQARTLGPASMLGAMAAVTLPNPPRGWEHQGPTKYWDVLQDRLLQRWSIQVPIHPVTLTGGERRRVVRISAAPYNSPEQYEYLAGALDAELAAEQGW